MLLTFVFDGLQVGGIERVGIEYIKLLSAYDIDINVINLRPDLCQMENEIPSNVKVFHITYRREMSPYRYEKIIVHGMLGKVIGHSIVTIMRCISTVYFKIKRKYIPNSDIAIAFSGHYNDLTFVDSNYKTSKKVAWLHGNENSYKEICSGYMTLYSHIKNLVCLSCVDDDKVEEYNTINGINKTLIYNPINMKDKVVNITEVNSLKEKYGDYILMVGRLNWDKDQETLIKAVKILNDKYGVRKYLVLVGDGPYRERLEQFTNSMGMSDQVAFVGSKTNVQDYYSAANIYAHSSPAEGLPTVILEAMYYGLPIVTTDSKPGVREILQENCGLISPVKDAEKLADNLHLVLADKELEKKLVNNGKERIKSFMPEFVIRKLLAFLNSI